MQETKLNMIDDWEEHFDVAHSLDVVKAAHLGTSS